MTASFVLPAAMNPPYITVSFDETRLTKNMIDADGKFSISVLHEDQISLARRFGFKSGKRINKFRNFDDYTLIDGLPL